MNFQSGISRIFQCGSSFVNLASVACVVGKGNVNRIWSLGQGIASLISKKDFKNRAHLACFHECDVSVVLKYTLHIRPPKKSNQGTDVAHARPRGGDKWKKWEQYGSKRMCSDQRAGDGRHFALCSSSVSMTHPSIPSSPSSLLPLSPSSGPATSSLLSPLSPSCWRPVFADLDANPSLPCWLLR